MIRQGPPGGYENGVPVLLVTVTRLAAVAVVRQVVGPRGSGEYVAWANWVLAGERVPCLLSSHSAFY